MRKLCAVIILLAGCTTVPNSKVEPTPLAKLKVLQPPMPSRATFALSETITWNPPPDTNNVYVSPVPTNSPSYGTIKLSLGSAFIAWNNWPTNTPYRIEVSRDLNTWALFSSGISSTNSTRIIIMDHSVYDDYPTFFYRLLTNNVAP